MVGPGESRRGEKKKGGGGFVFSSGFFPETLLGGKKERMGGAFIGNRHLQPTADSGRAKGKGEEGVLFRSLRVRVGGGGGNSGGGEGKGERRIFFHSRKRRVKLGKRPRGGEAWSFHTSTTRYLPMRVKVFYFFFA